MARRRRFGVSIPEELAANLDALASKLGRDRSSIVAEALRTFIHDHIHLLRPHRCAGVIIVWSRSGDGLRIGLEDYMDIVKGHMHTHIAGYCVHILAVEGDSERIASLTRILSSRPGCVARYIPLGGGGSPGGRNEPDARCGESGESKGVLPVEEDADRGVEETASEIRESS